MVDIGPEPLFDEKLTTEKSIQLLHLAQCLRNHDSSNWSKDTSGKDLLKATIHIGPWHIFHERLHLAQCVNNNRDRFFKLAP